VTWCWAIAFNTLPIYRSLDAETRKQEMNRVSAWAQGIVFLLFTVQGLCVYLVWGRNIDSDFISNLSLSDDHYIFYFSSWLATTTQFVIVVGCFLGLPLDAFTSRTNLHSILRSIQRSWIAWRAQNGNGNGNESVSLEEQMENEEQSEYLLLNENDRNITQRSSVDLDAEEASLAVRCAEAFVLIFSAAIVAIVCTDLNLIITLCGATYACFISYYVPGGVYIKSIHEQRGDAVMENHDEENENGNGNGNVGDNNMDRNMELGVHEMNLKYIAYFVLFYGTLVSVAGLVTTFL